MDRVKLSLYRVQEIGSVVCYSVSWIWPDLELVRLVGSGISSVDPSYESKTGPYVFYIKFFATFHLKVSIFLRETWKSLKNLVEALLCTFKICLCLLRHF
jgi:hypothetical protein